MNIRHKLVAVLALCAGLAAFAPPPLAQPAPAATSAHEQQGAWLERFYGPTQHVPAWTREQAQAALALLEQAPADGLDPRDYGVEALRREAASGEADPARFDTALTVAMLHYLADLRLGRVPSDY